MSPRGGAAARRREPDLLELARDPVLAAEAAGLRYVSDNAPGIVRRRLGKHFGYRGPDGRPVRDRATLARIRSLAIPPAWTEVWICPHPRGHVQATGRDARGRKQYRYHPEWRAVRDVTKYGRLLEVAAALPRLRQRVREDLSLPGLPREKVLATLVELLERTGIRIGNEEYRRQNDSHGLTTLQDHHAEVAGPELRFSFRAKSGKPCEVTVKDRRLARIVKRCQDIPGQELFQYVDEAGEARTIDSGDVNTYLREASGSDLTAKDFRTWAGTLRALGYLVELPAPESAAEAKRRLVETVDVVSEHLANTRSVCRKFYIHPGILESYAAGGLRELAAATKGGDPELSDEEHRLVGVLGALQAAAA